MTYDWDADELQALVDEHVLDPTTGVIRWVVIMVANLVFMFNAVEWSVFG